MHPQNGTSIPAAHSCPFRPQSKTAPRAISLRSQCSSIPHIAARPDIPSTARSTTPCPCDCHGTRSSPPPLCKIPDETRPPPPHSARRPKFQKRRRAPNPNMDTSLLPLSSKESDPQNPHPSNCASTHHETPSIDSPSPSHPSSPPQNPVCSNSHNAIVR